MKRIPLTQGQFALVDDADFEYLNQWKWYAKWDRALKNFYAARNNKKKNGGQYPIYMHREILGLKRGDPRQADHIDHTTLDNQRLNLRTVTAQQNGWNTKNSKGYYWHRRDKRFYPKIKLNGKDIYLGSFPTAGEARNAYLEAKKKYHKLEESRAS